MSPIASEFLDATPVVRLVQLNEYSRRLQLATPVIAGIMFDGATGSCVDHVTEGMLLLAVQGGALFPDMPVYSVGSGSFGLALALACRRLGHPLTLVMSAAVEQDRRVMLRGMGADVVTTNPLYGRDGQLKEALRLTQETGGYFVDPFDNEYNVAFHKKVTGPMLLKGLGGKVDIVVIGVGTSGTLTGVGEYLKAWAGNPKIVAVEPHECSVLSGGFAGKHYIPGLGAGFIPGNYNPYIVDEIIRVPSLEAQRTASNLLLNEGIAAGVASGAVACAATQLAALPENAGKRIVALLPTRQEI